MVLLTACYDVLAQGCCKTLKNKNECASAWGMKYCYETCQKCCKSNDSSNILHSILGFSGRGCTHHNLGWGVLPGLLDPDPTSLSAEIEFHTLI